MAQETRVKFVTHPSGAFISWGVKTRTAAQGQAWDYVSGDTVQLRMKSGQASFPWRAHLDGFDDLVGTLTLAELQGADPTVVDLGTLQPNTLRSWIQVNFWFLPCLGLVVGLTGWGAHRWLRVQREKSSQEKWRQREVGKAPLVGTLVGRYRILEKIGSGGMATVYRACPTEGNRAEDEVAVKLLEGSIQDESARQRFYREVTICAKLRHAYLVLLYEALEVDGRVGLVMELVRGKTLRAHLQVDPKPSLRQIDAWIRPLVDALAYAHGLGIVHRDLKPENVMVDGQGKIKLMDFGIAQIAQQARITQSGQILGTLTYMAPEQLRGEAMSERTDQFSLGMMLYEMLSGHLPFHEVDSAEGPIALIQQRLSVPAPVVRGVRPELSASSEQALERMLNAQPSQRFGDIKEAYEAFQKGISL